MMASRGTTLGKLLGISGIMLWLLAGCGGTTGGGGNEERVTVTRQSRLAVQLITASAVPGQTRGTFGLPRQAIAPGVVQRLHVEVRAADIPSPITADILDVNTSEVVVELVVPFGVQRQILVSAFNGFAVEIFQGEARVDLTRDREEVQIVLVPLLSSNTLVTQFVAASQGGTLSITDERTGLAGASLVIPPETLTNDETLVISLVNNTQLLPPLPEGQIRVSPVLAFTRSGIQFRQSAMLLLPYDAAAVTALGQSEAALRFFLLEDGETTWQEIQGTTVDPSTSTMRIPLDGFSFGTISVGSNTPPVAQDDSGTTLEDTAVTLPVLANDVDPESDLLLLVQVTQGSHGEVVDHGDGTVQYTPTPDFTGSDTFTYTVSNGQGGTATATVHVTVTPVNDAPVVAQTLAPVTVAEDASPTVLDLHMTFQDVDQASNDDVLTLSVQANSNPSLLTASLHGTTLTLTYAAQQHGSATVTLRATDQEGLLVETPLNVTVTPVNDAPVVAQTLAPVTVRENAIPTTLDLRMTFQDVDQASNGDVLSLSVQANSNPSLVSATLNGTILTLIYTPQQGGTATVTLRATDQGGLQAELPLSVTVIPNTPPVAVNDNASTSEDTPVTTGNVLTNDSDADGDVLQAATFTQPLNGRLDDNGNGTFTYTPSANFNGADSFMYTANDGQGGTASATVTIVVTAVNDPPVASADSATVAEDSGATALPVLANDSAGPANESAQTLTITAVTPGAHGTVSITGGGSGLTYTPVPDYTGPDSFTYTIQDNGTTNGQADSRTATATVSVTVTAVNAPPVASADSATVAEDSGATALPVLANDSAGPANESAQTLTITAVTPGAHGTVSITGGGSGLTYTPAPDYTGPDSFTYTIQDNGTTNGQADPRTATVSVTVTPVNDPPVASADSATVLVNNGAMALPVLANDSAGPANENAQTLTITAVTPGAHGGTVTITSGGSGLTYTPAPNYTGPDSFTYTIQDNGTTNAQADPRTATATVSVTVTGSTANYFGFNPSPGTTVTLLGWQDNTAYTLIDLDNGSSITSGTINRFQTMTLGPLGMLRHFQVAASAPLMALLGADCCNVSGSTFYPALDGRRLVGRNFILQLQALSPQAEFIIFTYEASMVTIRDTAGTVVHTQMIPGQSFFASTGAPLTPMTVYQIDSTGDIAIMSNAYNGNTAVPSSNGTDVGTLFLLGTRLFGPSAVVLFAYEDASVTGTDLETGVEAFTRNLTAGQFAYVDGFGDNKFKVSSTGKIGVWGGSPEGGTGVEFLGDDLTMNTGQQGRDILIHTQNAGAVVLATQDNTTVQLDGAPGMLLNTGGFLDLQPGALRRITADRPVVLQTVSAPPAELNDFATVLRLVFEDRDQDGLEDQEETALGTNPDLADTDSDGLRDGFEVRYGFNPLLSGEAAQDSDDDGLDNLAEQAAGTNPRNADTDGDGFSDHEEIQAMTDPLDPRSNRGNFDTDSDGLTDGDEIARGTDRFNPDTDNDGFSDGTEVLAGTNPLDPLSVPFMSRLRLFGSAHNGPDDFSHLYTINPSNGQAFLVGETGFQQISGMDFAPDGQLFAIGVRPGDPPTTVLLTLNTLTGRGTEIGPLLLEGSATDISFRHGDGQLFAYGFGFLLATVNILSGEASPVGVSMPVANFGGTGIAFSPTDTLFFAQGSQTGPHELHSLDQSNGNVTLLRPVLFMPPADDRPRFNALDFLPETQLLYGSLNNGSARTTLENYLATLNTATGVATIIGRTVDGLDALAWTPLPEDVDSDDDGLIGTVEVILGTDPLLADSDGDGLTDGVEVKIHQTNPRQRDTDGDGFDDAVEVVAGSNPLDPASFPDELPPIALITFPGVQALTEADPVTVRGQVFETTGIARITVHRDDDMVEATVEALGPDGFASWHAVLHLPLGHNLLTVETEDTLGNILPVSAAAIIEVGAILKSPRAVAVGSSGHIVLLDFDRPGIVRVDPVTGVRTIVSDASRGSGPALATPVSLVVEASGALVVLEFSSRALLRVDPLTGDRTLLSQNASPGMGTGPDLFLPLDLTMTPNGQLFVLTQTMPRSVIQVDPTTGDRTTVSSDPVGGGPNMLGNTLAAESNTSLLSGAVGQIVRIDLDTGGGDRTAVSDAVTGTGPALGNISGLARESSGMLVVSEFDGRVLRVDSGSGDRSIVADVTRGAGPLLPELADIAVEQDGQLLVVNADRATLFRVHPGSGDRNIVTDAILGTGPPLAFPRSVAAGSLVVGDSDDDGIIGALLRVDPAHGSRTILTSDTLGSGPLLQLPIDLLIESDEQIIVADHGSAGIVRLDPFTANRTPVSDRHTGSGPAFSDLRSIALQTDGHFVALDAALGATAVLRVDPINGNRTPLSDNVRGNGPRFDFPVALTVHHDPNGHLFVLDNGIAAVFRVDPVSGDRTIISDTHTGTGPPFSFPIDIAVLSDGDLVVADGSAIFRVDPESGDRTIIADEHSGTGLPFFSPGAMTVESTGQIIVLDRSLKAVVRIDPTTGDRALISR